VNTNVTTITKHHLVALFGVGRPAHVADDVLVVFDAEALLVAQDRLDLVPAGELELFDHPLELVFVNGGLAGRGAFGVQGAQPRDVALVQVVGTGGLRLGRGVRQDVLFDLEVFVLRDSDVLVFRPENNQIRIKTCRIAPDKTKYDRVHRKLFFEHLNFQHARRSFDD
jgi:hypothetical protein